MFGMDFPAFATLSVVSLSVSVVFFYGLHYRLGPGLEGFLVKIPLTWMGAWGGSPILGHWGIEANGIYLIPATLCSAGTLFLVTRFWKTINLVDAHELLYQRDLQQAVSRRRIERELTQKEAAAAPAPEPLAAPGVRLHQAS